MEKCLYFEICMFCVLITLLLVHNVKRQYAMMFEDKLFLSILWSATGLFLFDGVWVLMDGLNFRGAANINNLLNLLYFTQTGIIGLLWLIFTDYKIHENEERLQKRLKWYIIPFCVLTLMTLVSPWTGWIFSLEENNLYHRGRYHIFQMLTVYGYYTWAAIQAAAAWKRAEKRDLKSEYRVLSFFIILPVAGGIIQGIAYGYPLVWAGTALSLLMVFVNTQNQQITKDGLTGINNRRFLNHYLDTKIGNRRRKKKLFFILMDIDSFKEINDTYGHVEGDAAIIRIAGILKEVCCTNNDFLARYGGDEFAIVCEREDCQEVENLLREIDAIMAFSNEAGDLNYDMWLSIGYAEYGEEKMENQDQLIALADERLYQIKRTKKVCAAKN